MKLLLDFVPNHTSDRHPWFAESRASRDSSNRAWYHWRDPAPGGGPPEAYEAMLPTWGWPSWVLGNHDKSRIASRVGAAQARVAAMLLLTLRGTPTMYYGDELGMRDVPVPAERVRDPFERNVPGLGLGRDPVRTPMQWESGPGGGFTTGEPWLPLAADAGEVHAAAQREDPRSLLALYRRLLALRRAEPALCVGAFASLRAPGDLLAWVRKEGDRRSLVVLNLGPQPAAFTPAILDLQGRVALSTALDREGEPVRRTVELRGDEGVVVRLD